jgi:hypothetical protein
MSVVLLGSTSGSITLQEPAVAGTNTVNFGANTGVAILDANTPAFRNRILNGSMILDQRNAGASVTIGATTNGYTLDRWAVESIAASKFSVQQSTVAPTGFTNSLLVTSLAATAVGANDYYSLRQRIEGFNTADFGWGTASAQTVTLSFWVQSSLTGTFGGVMTNSANNRSYPFSYSISSSNTWEQKTISVAGDTTGTWLTNSGVGIAVYFGLGIGSTYLATANSWVGSEEYGATGQTNIVATNGATFYITGVQLEKGSTATSFDYRPYGTELALCQRYYQFIGGTADSYPLVQGYGVSAQDLYFPIPFPVQMRSAPTVVKNGTWSVTNCGQPTFIYANRQGGSFTINATANGNITCYPNTTDDTFTFSAEL